MTSDLVKLLYQCLDSHHTARNLIFEGADLKGSQLSGLRANSLNFENADLRESNLVQVKWSACMLRDARIDGADFTDAILRLCDFDQARVINAQFVNTRLENSTARAAKFDGSNLMEAVLTDTDFSRASFRGANLEGISASGASFRGADLSRTNLRNAELVDTDLRGADLTDADLDGVVLDGADLRGAIGLEDYLEETATATLPQELKPLIGTVAPLVDEMLRSAGQTGWLDPEAAEQLKIQIDAIQRTYPSRSIHPDTLQAVSDAVGSLADEDIPSLLAALGQTGNEDPPLVVQTLIRHLGQVLALGENASADEVLARLATTESSEKLDSKMDL